MTLLQPFVVQLAKIISSVYSIATGGGLFGIIGLAGELLAIRGTDFKGMVAAVKTLSDADRVALEQAFETALSLPKDVEDKIQTLVNSLEDLIVLVEHGVSLINQVRTILGV